MANYICPHCDANNPDPGRCVMCDRHIGSLKRALLFGAAGTLVLGLLWIVISLGTGMQFPLTALFFGGFVSFCVSHFSGGRGIVYQLIATLFTIAGIVVADSLTGLLIAHFDESINLATFSLSDFLNYIRYTFEKDDFTSFFYVLGVMGGFYIWR